MLRCLQLDVITAAAAGTQMNEFAAQLERAVSWTICHDLISSLKEGHRKHDRVDY